MNIKDHIEEALSLAEYYKEPEILKARLLKLTEPKVVSKGLVSKSHYVTKAWTIDGKTFVEGWISTEDKDTEKDIVPPEAFLNSMKGYFDRRAPLSSNHSVTKYPIGHLQKSILVRDGIVLKSFEHPTDKANFEHFPGFGTGWYARAIINDKGASESIINENIGGFSWIGKVTKAQKLSDGGYKFIEVDPLMESTIAAYPVNPNAQITHISN